MSAESVLASLKKPKLSPLEEQLDVESDKRLFGCMGSGSVLGIALVAFALSIQINAVLNPGALPPAPPEPKVGPRIKLIIPDDAYHGPITRPKPQITKHTPKPGTPGSRASKPRSANPSEHPGQLAAHLVTSKRGLAGVGAYDILGKSMRNIDLDKLTQFQTLTRTGATRLGGRRGKMNTEFNVDYNVDGTGGGGGMQIEIPEMPNTRFDGETKGPKGISKPIAIDMFENTTARSTASILAVIRSHSPGLRFVYNSFLK